jgi:hypothetical protein
MIARNILVALAVAVLAGCATPEKGLNADTLLSIRHGGITTRLGSDSPFREQTKGKVVGATAVSVAAALMGGGNRVYVGTRNTAPKEGYLDTNAWKSLFDETEAATFDTPLKAMDASIRRRLTAQGIATNEDSSYSLTASSIFWGIDYEKLTESDNYRLYFNLNLQFRRGMFVLRTVECTGATLEKHSYDEWMANDRERVRHQIAAVGDSCASRMLAQLDLGATEPQPLVAAETR